MNGYMVKTNFGTTRGPRQTSTERPLSQENSQDHDPIPGEFVVPGSRSRQFSCCWDHTCGGPGDPGCNRSPYSRCRNQHADQPQNHFKSISCQMWSLQKPKRARRLGVHAGMCLMVRLAQRRSQWRPSASMPCWPRVKGSRLLAREAKLGRSSLRAVTPAARVPGHAVIFLTKMCL